MSRIRRVTRSEIWTDEGSDVIFEELSYFWYKIRRNLGGPKFVNDSLTG